MSAKVHNMLYRGNLCGLDGYGKTISFITNHVERIPTALYQIDGESHKLTSIPLGFEASCMLRIDEQIWIGSLDGSLHSVSEKSKKLTSYKLKLDDKVVAMAQLSNNRLAIVSENQVAVVSTGKSLSLLQSIELNHQGTAIASNPDGNWFVVGTKEGTVSVFQCEDSDGFELSETEQIHEGSIHTLLFEPDELRFFSAGDDRKLLLTHARGKLEPEDRGGSNSHEDQIFDMVLAGEDRLITGSQDAKCKSWARKGGAKPQTQSSDLAKVRRLAVVEIHKRKNLAVACNDNSIRLFLIKEDERIGDLLVSYNDLYKRVKQKLRDSDPAVREATLQELFEFDDRRTSELLAEQISLDSDYKLRLVATKLLAKSGHAQLPDLLMNHLAHKDAAIRQLVLNELIKLQKDSLVELYQAALKTGQADTGSMSVDGLVKIATNKASTSAERNRAQSVLAGALNSKTVEIRNETILALEKLFDKNSPNGNLMALECKSPDSKRKGLIRLFQRNLLDDVSAAAGLRRAVEDGYPEVRQTAFFVSVLSRPALSKVLRERNKDIDRKLTELEKFNLSTKPSKSVKGKISKEKRG
jgi:ParB family transcriptional regulator, chromosome partitioning protein